MADFAGIASNLIGGRAKVVKDLVTSAIAEGVPPQQILNDALIVGMSEVGRRFQANEFYVPEVLRAARAIHTTMEVFNPLLAEKKVRPRGVIALGTVKGDLHDTGKNLVGIMLEGNCFQVIDLGMDCPPEKFVATAKEQKPDVIAMSALLTTTMTNMKTTMQSLKEEGVREQVKMMVAGAQAFAVFLMSAFFQSQPAEMFESSRVDGATELESLLYSHSAGPRASRPAW